jgi:hypothetical protein
VREEKKALLFLPLCEPRFPSGLSGKSLCRSLREVVRTHESGAEIPGSAGAVRRATAWAYGPRLVPDMTTAIAKPSRQKLQAKTASRPRAVSGKLAEACRLMVEEGLTYQEAAAQAGLQTRSMYVAMQRTHVLRHLRRLREAFVERVCIDNPRHLVELRGQRANMGAAVKAVAQLETMRDAPLMAGASSQVPTMPGLVIVVNNAPSRLTQPDASEQPAAIDAEPVHAAAAGPDQVKRSAPTR